jgi:TM2 domain-containing membrane protein YozV
MGQKRKNPTVAFLLTLFTGGIGGQMFYLNDPTTGMIYLLLCWTFIPLLLSVFQLFTITKETRSYNRVYPK